MSSPTSAPLGPGARLAHYEVRRTLGEGAMGTVYEAYDTALDRLVAIKVVHPELADDPEIAARFLDEPRAAARVVHDNLAHVYFVGTTEGRPFYAMELVPGATFEHLVEAEGPLPLGRVVDLLTQAAQGLGAAHAAGLVHRDVKPGNLLLRSDGRVKVTDFGLSKLLKTDARATQVGSIVGTPDYMSPEQCRGRAVDPRSDVYSLGLTAYYLLTGERPWKATALGDLLDQQMHAPLPTVRARRPDLPAGVDLALARWTAKEPDRRPASMADVVALLDALRPRPVLAAPLVARATALLIDVVLLTVVTVAPFSFLALLEGWTGISWLTAMVAGLVAGALLVLAQFGMERWYGGSVGKLLLHLRVVAEDGTRPTTSALVRRLLLRIPVLPLIALPEPTLPAIADHIVQATECCVLVAGALTHLATRGRTFWDVGSRTRVTYGLERR